MKPIIRWIGGKDWAAETIASHMPDKVNSYHERCIGGGSVLIHLMETGRLKPGALVTISDKNDCYLFWFLLVNSTHSLISAYENLFDSVDGKAGPDQFAAWRLELNCSPRQTPRRAALFLALNQLCFQGMYRVNKVGAYNVPIDPSKKLRRLTDEILELRSELGKYNVLVAPGWAHVNNPEVVYLDPPYYGKGSFVGYDKDGFSDGQQVDMAVLAHRFREKGSLVIASNSDCEWIRALYAPFEMHQIFRRNSVSSKASSRKELIPELLMIGRP